MPNSCGGIVMEQTALKEDIVKYATLNPIKIYGDYNDTIPDNIIDAIVTGDMDYAYELMDQIEMDMQLNDDYSILCAYQEYLKDNNLEDHDDLWESFRDNCCFDYSDMWDSAFRNTRIKLAVTLLDDNGEPISPPYQGIYHDPETFESQKSMCLEFFGDNGAEMNPCYEHEIIKIGGTCDLQDFLKNGLPTGIRIGKRDAGGNILSHDSLNGSGCEGHINPTKERIFKCTIRNDSSNRHGIDAVWGFTRDYWDHELDFIFSEKE